MHTLRWKQVYPAKKGRMKILPFAHRLNSTAAMSRALSADTERKIGLPDGHETDEAGIPWGTFRGLVTHFTCVLVVKLRCGLPARIIAIRAKLCAERTTLSRYLIETREK